MARAGRGTLAVVLVLGLAACSGGDDEKDAAPVTRPTPVATTAPVRASPSPTPVVKRRTQQAGAQLGGKFCTFLVKEQRRLAGLDRFAALTRLNLDLGANAGRAVDGRRLQAQAAACPGPARKVLRATGLSSFSAL